MLDDLITLFEKKANQKLYLAAKEKLLAKLKLTPSKRREYKLTVEDMEQIFKFMHKKK